LTFIGTAAFAVPSLRALHRAGHDVALVVTQPDRPGHRLRLTPPPVKAAAQELGLEVFQPERVRAPESVERLTAAAPELIVVVAYGQIIPRSVLEIPPGGILNVHGSLLPRHRGAAPIAHAILSGDSTTGVTIMRMDELLDHGPILTARETAIGPHEDAAALAERLAPMGAELLGETIARLDEIVPVEQDHSGPEAEARGRRAGVGPGRGGDRPPGARPAALARRDPAIRGRPGQGPARPAAVRPGRAGTGAAGGPRRGGGGGRPGLVPAGGGAAAGPPADPAAGAGGAACLSSGSGTSRSTAARSTTTSSTSATRPGWC
jgi:folate-dependent phosphoribosylglycinamide formyltransferase PurN